MKKIFIILLFISFSSLSQEEKFAEDYKLINKTLIFIQNRYFLEKVYLHKTTIKYRGEIDFFKSNRLSSYIESGLARDEDKFKTLLSALEKEGMGDLVRPAIPFDKRKLIPGVELVDAIPGMQEGRKNYALSVPLFSKNRNYAFVFYRKSCGFLCASWQLVIYKNINKEWYAVEQVSVTL